MIKKIYFVVFLTTISLVATEEGAGKKIETESEKLLSQGANAVGNVFNDLLNLDAQERKQHPWKATTQDAECRFKNSIRQPFPDCTGDFAARSKCCYQKGKGDLDIEAASAYFNSHFIEKDIFGVQERVDKQKNIKVY